MAWTYEQKFNDLTTADLNGQDSWSGNAIFDVVTTTPAEGAKRVASVVESDTELTIDRSITGISAGIVYISMKVNRLTGMRRGSFEIYSNTTLVMRLFIIRDGASNNTIQMLSAEGANWFTLASGISNDTWYRIGIEFDDAAHPDKYRCNVDGGTWSAWRSTWSAYTTVNKIRLADQGNNGSGTGTIGYDFISPNYAATTEYTQAVTATAVGTGSMTMTKNILSTLTASAVATASMLKGMSQTLTANVTNTASILAGIAYAEAMEALATVTASIEKALIRAQALTASAVATASMTKIPGKLLEAATTITATIISGREVIMIAAVTATATVTSGIAKVLTAVVTVVAKVTAPFHRIKYPPHGDETDYDVKYTEHGDADDYSIKYPHE